MSKVVIKEVLLGNGNQFTVKELLHAHIQDGKKFEDYVRDKLGKGTTKIATNRTSIDNIKDILRYGIVPFMVIIIGTLIKISL